MHRKLTPLASTLVLSALLASGCGGSDKTTASDTASTPAATAATSTTGAATTSTSGTSTSLADNPQVKAAIARCKASIDANPQVKDSIKADVKAICDKAASGNPQDVKAAIRQVCEKIVESSLPPGDARDQAKKTCASAGD